jgi:hypothetical protein
MAFASLAIACASSGPSDIEAPLVRRIYQPIGREIVAGDILIVRGVLRYCLNWRGRILDVETVGANNLVSLRYAPVISPIGMWPADVRDAILRFYAEVRPNDTAPRVTVEVLSSAEYDAGIAKEASLSLLAVHQEYCPENPPEAPSWWTGY